MYHIQVEVIVCECMYLCVIGFLCSTMMKPVGVYAVYCMYYKIVIMCLCKMRASQSPGCDATSLLCLDVELSTTHIVLFHLSSTYWPHRGILTILIYIFLVQI